MIHFSQEGGIDVELNLRLKAIRKENKLTQGMLADYLGVDQSYITKIESGERPVTTDILGKLASLYGCDTEMLLDEDSDIRPLRLAFRTKQNVKGTLQVLAAVNQIALNLRDLEIILGDDDDE